MQYANTEKIEKKKKWNKTKQNHLNFKNAIRCNWLECNTGASMQYTDFHLFIVNVKTKTKVYEDLEKRDKFKEGKNPLLFG